MDLVLADTSVWISHFRNANPVLQTLLSTDHSCSGGLDGETQPLRSLTHALVEAQQSQADERGTRNDKRCEVDGVECPNRVTGKRLTRAIDCLGRDSEDMPMSSSRDEVRSTVGGLRLRQFSKGQRPQQYAITLDQRQVGGDDDLGPAKQLAHRGCSWLVKEPCQHRARLGIEIHRVPRSSSSNWATLRRRSPCLRSSAGYRSVPVGAPRVSRPRLASD